jgi:hypothetical protein
MRKPSTTRRGLIGSGAAALLLAPAAVAEAGPAEADAELLRLCAAFPRLEAEYRRLSDIEDDSALGTREKKRALAKHTAFSVSVYRPALEKIAATPARTPAGWRAKAEVLRVFHGRGWPEKNYPIERVLASLIEDMAGSAPA